MKDLIAQHRILKLELWVARQPLDRFLNRKVEEALLFKARLLDWVSRDVPSDVAPTFHFCPEAKI